MKRWLLMLTGLAAAGSAIGATTKPASPKAAAPQQVVKVKSGKARPAVTTAPKATQPAPTLTLPPSPATTSEELPTPTAPVPAATREVVEAPAAAPAPAPTVEAPATTPPSVDPSGAPGAEAPPAVQPPAGIEIEDVVIEKQGDTLVQIDRNTGKVIAKRQLSNGGAFAAYGINDPTPAPLRKTISLDVSNATPVEAIEAVMKQVGGPIALAVSKEVPNEPRISLKVSRVSAGGLLTLITQNAGLEWSMDTPGKGQTAQLRIMKARPGSKASISFFQGLGRPAVAGEGSVDLLIAPRVESNYLSARSTLLGEQRLTLQCPHCMVKSTIIRQRSQPKCAKCSRTFQGDWQFCPIDGSKRPADPNEWKFCPACGKKVEIEKASIEEGGVPILSDLPILGELFRKPSNPSQHLAVPVPGLPRLGSTPPYPGVPPAVPSRPGASPTPRRIPATPVPVQPAKPSAPPTPVEPQGKPELTPAVPAIPAPEPEPAAPSAK